jgi:hypothetical protein
VSRRGRLAFAAACLLGFALVAGYLTWSGSSSGPSGGTTATGTPAPGAARLAVADLGGVEGLRDRFNADRGVPRLVLALSPT